MSSWSREPSMAQPASFRRVDPVGGVTAFTPLMSNDESPEGAITTVTFDEIGGKTRVVVRDLYPSKESLDAAIASESTGGFSEQFEQLDKLLITVVERTHER